MKIIYLPYVLGWKKGRPPPQKKPKTKTAMCIVCHTDTGIDMEIPTGVRLYYDPALGQLCPKCYAKLHPILSPRR